MRELFVPASVNFVKKRAAELKTSVPYLSLAKALETTSIALGYQSWHDCSNRIEAGYLKQSPPDEDVSPAQRLWRRHQQGCALVDVASMPPFEADEFVRYWSPTARTRRLKPEDYRSAYQAAIEQLEEYKALLNDPDADDNEWWSSANPSRLKVDLMQSCSHKHAYLVPSEEALQAIPFHIRGNGSAFLEFEDANLLALTRPDWFDNSDSIDRAMEYMRQFRPTVVQWQTGEIVDKRGPRLDKLLELAESSPDAWFPLSYRMEISGTDPSPPLPKGDQYVLPMLNGIEFGKFIRNKGELRFADVRWFKAPRYLVQKTGDLDNEAGLNPVAGAQKKLLIPLEVPPYLSPFKHGPMGNREYDLRSEGGGLLISDELEFQDAI